MTLERLLELARLNIPHEGFAKQKQEYQSLKQQIEQALEFWNCPDLNETTKQNAKIVDEIRDKDFQKTLWWLLDSLKNKNPDADLPFFKNSIIRLVKLQELLEGKK